MQDEVQILDEFGEVLKVYTVPQGKTQFEGVSWKGAYLYGAQLGGACFKDADLYWAGFFMAHLDGADFENANLRGVDLKQASCVGANFRGADLGKDSLGGRSQLQGADFTGAILNHVTLDGAEYDKETKFPTGFDPTSHGMKKA